MRQKGKTFGHSRGEGTAGWVRNRVHTVQYRCMTVLWGVGWVILFPAIIDSDRIDTSTDARKKKKSKRERERENEKEKAQK